MIRRISRKPTPSAIIHLYWTEQYTLSIAQKLSLVIFAAEARRILLALDMIHLSTGSQFLFLSDSLSCLQSLKIKTSHILLLQTFIRVHGLISEGSNVVFMWVPRPI